METIKIEKLVFGGQALGRASTGQVVFIWNALPGETVEVNITKKQKTHWEGITTKILDKSPERVEPIEKHFLSCSPWQILSYESENDWKVKIATETYKKIGGLELDLNIAHTTEPFHYRNKIEYSFAESDGKIHLAFFERGKKIRTPIPECVLANEKINEAAQNILEWINKEEIPIRSLKALIGRTNSDNQVALALFIKDKLTFSSYPKLDSSCLGFQLYYSTHKSPASVPTELMYSVGDNFLVSKLLNAKLKFGNLSFFQVNSEIFEAALKDMENFLEPDSPVLDLYSGVGSISIPLSKNIRSCTLVDNNEEAIALAINNITLNNLANYEAICKPMEKITELIENHHTVLLDPPRAGLHEDVTKRLLEVAPKRIIYLSCDLATHARDIGLLKEKYALVFSRLYNFFPRTPHIEGLVVLERS